MLHEYNNTHCKKNVYPNSEVKGGKVRVTPTPLKTAL